MWSTSEQFCAQRRQRHPIRLLSLVLTTPWVALPMHPCGLSFTHSHVIAVLQNQAGSAQSPIGQTQGSLAGLLPDGSDGLPDAYSGCGQFQLLVVMGVISWLLCWLELCCPPKSLQCVSCLHLQVSNRDSVLGTRHTFPSLAIFLSTSDGPCVCTNPIGAV